MMKKELYAAPATEVLELSLDSGVLVSTSTRGVSSVEGSEWEND